MKNRKFDFEIMRLTIICALILVLLTSCGAEYTYRGDEPSAQLSGYLFTDLVEMHPPHDPDATVTVREPTDEYNFLKMRLLWFAGRFNAQIYMSLWDTLEDTPYSDTYDIAEEAEELGKIGDNTYFLAYSDSPNQRSIFTTGMFDTREVAYLDDYIFAYGEMPTYYKFTALIDDLWRHFGEYPTTVSMSLTGSADYENTAVEEALEPLRKRFTGHVYIECVYSDDGYTQEDADYFTQYVKARTEDSNFLDYMRDTIVILYNGNTGEAVVNIGDLTGISVDNIEKIEASFGAAANNQDYSGFAKGVKTLAKALPIKPSFWIIALTAIGLILVIYFGRRLIIDLKVKKLRNSK